MTTRIVVCTLVALCLWPPVTFADLQTTQRLEAGWRSAADLDGEVVTLPGAGRSFVAIHRPQTLDQPIGAIVLLHGRGTNADSHEVIRPLRIGLSEAGWETLSLQLPVTFPNAGPDAWLDNTDQIAAGLQSALDWLKQRDQRNQAVLAVGDSGLIALRHAAAAAPKELQAVVLISSPADFAGEGDGEMLGRLRLRILDIYAERDRQAVTRAASARKRAARKAGITRFDQRTVPGAVPGYRAQEAQLLAAIRAWLNANAGGKERIGKD